MTAPHPAVIALELVEDAHPPAGSPEVPCQCCGRPCWLPARAQDVRDRGGLAFAVCARCMYDDTLAPSPGRIAEQRAWRGAYWRPAAAAAREEAAS